MTSLSALARAASKGDRTLTLDRAEGQVDCYSNMTESGLLVRWWDIKSAGLNPDADFYAACTPARILELVAEMERLEEALKEAREALKPFAEEAEYWIGGSDSDNPFDVYFTVADLHEAARTLKTDPAPGDE